MLCERVVIGGSCAVCVCGSMFCQLLNNTGSGLYVFYWFCGGKLVFSRGELGCVLTLGRDRYWWVRGCGVSFEEGVM